VTQTLFSATVEIAAPPERVWAVMQDVERWHEWTASIRSVKLLGGGPFGVGRRAVVRQPKLPPALWTVTEVAAERGFTWVSGAPGMRVTGRHTVEPSGSGTRATLSIHYGGFFGPVLAWLTRGVNERYLAMEAAGLKRRSEDGR